MSSGSPGDTFHDEEIWGEIWGQASKYKIRQTARGSRLSLSPGDRQGLRIVEGGTIAACGLAGRGTGRGYEGWGPNAGRRCDFTRRIVNDKEEGHPDAGVPIPMYIGRTEVPN